jgi:hypothetical protein
VATSVSVVSNYVGLAISVDATGVGKAIPERPILRAAVIGAVIAVGMIGAVIAG